VPDPADANPAAELRVEGNHTAFEKLNMGLDILVERRHSSDPATFERYHTPSFGFTEMELPRNITTIFG